MSLILDALNKSDSERNQNNAPSINSNHDVDVNGGRVNGNHKLVILASIAAILLAIAIILFVVLSPSDTPSSAALNATQTSSQSAQAAALDRGEQSDTNDLKPRKIDKLKERAIAAHYQQAQINEQESKAPKNIDGAAASALGDNKESDQKVLAIYQQEKKANSASGSETPANDGRSGQARTHIAPYSSSQNNPSAIQHPSQVSTA